MIFWFSIFAFTNGVNVCASYSTEEPEEYEGMLDKTYVIVGLTCLIIGSAGYTLYGDAVKDEVTLNLPAGIVSTVVGLYTLNPDDSSIESTPWFQPLDLSSDFLLVLNFSFSNSTCCTTTPWRWRSSPSIPFRSLRSRWTQCRVGWSPRWALTSMPRRETVR
jgi:hypothetical protein